MNENQLSHEIIGAALEVHKTPLRVPLRLCGES
jgi:hypothetical protein